MTIGCTETSALEETIEVVVSSAAFQRAPALRRLLLYLWECRDAPPGEYAIAVDALGRRPDFDPKLDATVRVHISRLRQKLKEFFESEGQVLPVRLSIPPGEYRLVAEAAIPTEDLPAPAVQRRPWFRIGCSRRPLRCP